MSMPMLGRRTHNRMLEMQAGLPPLAGFLTSVRSTRVGPTSPRDLTTASKELDLTSNREPSVGPLSPKNLTTALKELDRTSSREPSVGAKSTCEGDSCTESTHSSADVPMYSPSAMMQHLCESDSGDDDFFPSDHSEIPSTREPSPEPFWDTAKRYGCSAENIFPERMMIHCEQNLFAGLGKGNLMSVIPHGQIPLVYSSSNLLSSSVQSNATDVGFSPDYLAKLDSQHGCFKEDVDSDVCSNMGNASTIHSVSEASFDEMQRVSRTLNRDTTWFRVVHRGYGQVAWRTEVKNVNLTVVHGPFASEGDYVLIPEGLRVENIIEMLTKVNMTVRKVVWFKAMKRANKSRVLFKWEPFSVPLTGAEKPILVETNAFSCRSESRGRPAQILPLI